MAANVTKLYVNSALLADGWAANVQITLDDRGCVGAVEKNLPTPDPGAERIIGTLIPGMANCHSHAFQRAMVGLAEVHSTHGADFWGWRDIMYRFVGTIGPEQLRAIAAQLYIEMLKAGYTAVGEFHYLHHTPEGTAYDDPAEMSHAIAAAARATGIQLTLLPVLYQYGDFNATPAGPQQQRFLHDIDDFQRLLAQLASTYPNTAQITQGLALHSLRAVDETLLTQAVTVLDQIHHRAPVHIHIAEQTREVEACIAHTGQRPVEWLLDHAPVDDRWCLVHATHLSTEECQRLAASKAVAGLCPTTEANLGDGLFPAIQYMQAGGRVALGSDSHISVSPVEELRLLEYGQRLQQQRRTLLADDTMPSVGAYLYQQALRGGAQSLGVNSGSIAPGMRADFIVLDSSDPVLYGKHHDQLLDAWVFASQRPNVKDVMVGGQWQIRDGRHQQEEEIQRAFFKAIDFLKAGS